MTKKKLLAPLFIAASFLIIGCSANEIVGRPSWIDDPIVVDPNKDYKDNTLKEIYDAIKNLGDTNSNVLNKVMYDIAKKHIGAYEDLVKYANEATPVEELNQFVNDHSVYAADKYGYKKEGDTVTKVELNDEQKVANSRVKIAAIKNRIKEDVCKKLFEEIKGGSYSTKIDKFFEESYFIDHLYKEMYYEGTYPVTDPSLCKDVVFFPKKAGDSWVTYVDNKFLNVFKDDSEEFSDYYAGYADRKLLPEIYRTLLIEKYVREQRETNLGRSYAREVNMISVPKTDDHYTEINIKQMLTNYARDNLVTDTNTNLEPIKDAMVGFADATSTSTMLAGLEPLKIDNKEFFWKIRTDDKGKPVTSDWKSTKVYRGTKLYDVVEKYLKIVNVTYAGTSTSTWKDFIITPKEHLTSDEQSAYNDLTNNGAYTIEKGLELKEREIRLTDMTTDGWFLKTGGITDLDSKISDRLFNITTARIVDNENYIGGGEPDINDTARYFGKTAYIFKDKYDEDHVEDSIILEGGNNFYIVQVLEAASASKLATEEDADGAYVQLKATEEVGKSNDLTNRIFNKVTEQVANSDTYKKNAEQYYLMISNIIFNDQSVYDYFKSQFPDLFK